MSGLNGKTVSIKVKIAVTPEARHGEVLTMIDRLELRRMLEDCMVNGNHQTRTNGIQDGEGCQVAGAVVSLAFP